MTLFRKNVMTYNTEVKFLKTLFLYNRQGNYRTLLDAVINNITLLMKMQYTNVIITIDDCKQIKIITAK